MSIALNSVIKNLRHIDKYTYDSPNQKISAIFGENTFSLKVARAYLSDETYKKLSTCIKSGNKLDVETADNVANGIKVWAEKKGATHYTHWFQPLTGTTAEKHDSFFTIKSDGNHIEELNGSSLIQQEPDASSFPSGGLRSTFEARGYTAWDPSSPVFIIDIGSGKTVCIPTIYISYTGDSLDYKAPLLKALDALNTNAVAVCNYFDKNITRVIATLGWEQEYFIVDEGFVNSRPDLIQSGKTVVGTAPSKGQQLEDHYFGTIPARVYGFMKEYEDQCYKLGIPLRTRHNEVAPSQFEVAPVYEEVNVAVDHNLLLMDIMDKIARKHSLRVLFHEKPFAGINGSGKHNNWSMSTNTGVNLLAPGKTPKNNLMFLTFFVVTIKAVHDYADLLRASIASAPNDYRLGANEAPPAIISVFIGKFLTALLKDIEERVDNKKMDEQDEELIKVDVLKSIPEIILDNTDRNRTSPFAFTGNKFEFRAVGSSANCSSAMIALNTAIAETLKKFKIQVDGLIATGTKKEIAIVQVIQKYITESKSILFEGNGYSEEWHKEAEKRKLPNLKNTPLALDVLSSEKIKKLYTSNNVYTTVELEARQEIEFEKYIKNVQIESRLIGSMSIEQIIPEAIQYQNQILTNILQLKNAGLPESAYKAQLKLVTDISTHINKAYQYVEAMIEKRKLANKITHAKEKAHAYAKIKEEYFDTIRYSIDKLELLVADNHWHLPKYREMLFIK